MQVTANTALLLIDLQCGFDIPNYWGKQRNNPYAEQVCFELLQFWRKQKLPIFHVQHTSNDPQSPLHPSHAGFAFKTLTQPMPNEIVIQKSVNSAFIGTDLQQQLQQQAITQLVIVGLTTDHCISTTTRMAGNLGYTVYVVENATATFDRQGLHGEHYSAQQIHQIHLASLHNEFTQVIHSDEILKS
ncbi:MULTISPECIES: cysteine hydrolase family protein [unclassified Acinetobacter]|uniref:cysteine hydrolase family protein n=1 Tax=unclassified Acinetobacter TaxID=196816 RepID=UPI0035BB3459